MKRQSKATHQRFFENLIKEVGVPALLLGPIALLVLMLLISFLHSEFTQSPLYFILGEAESQE